MLPLILQAGAGGERMDIVSLIAGASGVVMGVLALLILLSLASWYVIGSKALYLSRAVSNSARFAEVFWKTKLLDDIGKAATAMPPSPVSEVFRAGYTELTKLRQMREQGGEAGAAVAQETRLGDIESIERAMERARTTQITEMESMVPLLGTTASSAPFIGLFGTVLGIVEAFAALAANAQAGGVTEGAANIMSGISEALVATAVGLLVALPAVAVYNVFGRWLKTIVARSEAIGHALAGHLKSVPPELAAGTSAPAGP